MKAICVLKCGLGHQHGVVNLEEIYPQGPLRVSVFAEGVPSGLHGFHVHRKGDERDGSHSLCDHFNPSNNKHGGRNSPTSHAGDFGNLRSDSRKVINDEFLARFVSLSGQNSILGRSLVLHSGEDDLGKGHHSDSETTGHSGSRILWGVIGVNDDLDCT